MTYDIPYQKNETNDWPMDDLIVGMLVQETVRFCEENKQAVGARLITTNKERNQTFEEEVQHADTTQNHDDSGKNACAKEMIS